MLKAWQVNVSGAAAAIGIPGKAIFSSGSDAGPGLEEPRALTFRVEPGTGGEKVYLVTQQVVSFGTVAAARTDQTVIPVDIDRVPAEGASKLGVEDGSKEPSLNRGAVEGSADVFAQSWGWHRVQPLAGTTGSG